MRLADDFDDFCFRASKLAEESKGAPLFTVSQRQNSPKPVSQNNVLSDNSGFRKDDLFDVLPMNDEEGNAQEDDWQLLWKLAHNLLDLLSLILTYHVDMVHWSINIGK